MRGKRKEERVRVGSEEIKEEQKKGPCRVKELREEVGKHKERDREGERKTETETDRQTETE